MHVHFITPRAIAKNSVPSEWLFSFANDEPGDVLAVVSRHLIDLCVYWPDIAIDMDACYRMLDAVKTARQRLGKHYVVGMCGTDSDGFRDVPDGSMLAADWVHGPCAFRPTLAAALLSHGLGMEGSFSERLSACVRLSHKRPAYVIASDFRPESIRQPKVQFLNHEVLC